MTRPSVYRRLRSLAIGLGSAYLSAVLAGCGYDGWVRYPCQEYENWTLDECQRPRCEVAGVCTDDILGESVIVGNTEKGKTQP